MTTPIPAEITTPDTVETRIGTLKFNDGFPTDETVQKVYDNLDFMRGVDAFLNAMPGASTEGLRQGLASNGADNNQTVLLFEDLMDSKSLFLTANTESIYSLMWLDTKAGPWSSRRRPTFSASSTTTGSNMWRCRAGRPGQGQGRKIPAVAAGLQGRRPRGLFRLPHQDLRQPVVLARLPRERQHATAVETPRNTPRFIACGRRQPAADEVHQRLRQVVQHHPCQHLQVLRGGERHRPVRAKRGLSP